MRRSVWFVVAAGTVALAGCEGLKDAFSPQANVVATAAGRKLETDRLVALLANVPSGDVTADGARFLAGLWVDLNLFADARIGGPLAPGQPDSAIALRSMWPQALQGRIQAWQDTLAARRPAPSPASADSAYDAGDARLFQHIIVQPAGATAKDTAAARGKIAGMLAQVRKGADFGTLAGQNADASRSDKGFLPVGPRGQFVKEFEDAAWALQPGQVSDVVQSSFGYHLILRTPKAEAQPRFLAYLKQSGGQRADSVYIADLTKANGLKMVPDAGAKLKTAVTDLEAARKNTTRLASFSKGAFTVADFAKWMEALPPGASQQIQAQPDSILSRFVEGLAQNTLVERQMDSAKLAIPAANWQALVLAHRATVDQLAAAIGLSEGFVADTAQPIAARRDSAAAKVEVFLDQLVAGQAQFRPLPGSLSGYLRENGKYRLNRAGLARAIELIQAKHKADSAAGKLQPPAQQGPVQPAPGGPPVTPPPAQEPPKN